MEEAEALCTRIGIVAAGELRCIGTAQHLKLKIGKGYFLTVNLISESSSNAPEGAAAASDVEHAIVSPADVERQRLAALVEFVTTTLGRGHPDTKLINAVNRTKKFKIAQAEGVCISEIFRLMELNKDRLYVREWGLSMSTLEDVFIAATQSPEEQA
jgi:ABC-type multidrug transport system ATPase subunit